MKNIFQNIIHFSCAISIFIIALWELKYICKYENIDLILTSEIQGYNFTYIYSILNIINSIFLLWILLDRSNKIIINYAIVLFIMNLIMGLWNISLYYNLKVIGRFNQVIIIQFYIFVIELSLSLIYLMITYYNKSNENKEYYIVLEEPLQNNEI